MFSVELGLGKAVHLWIFPPTSRAGNDHAILSNSLLRVFAHVRICDLSALWRIDASLTVWRCGEGHNAVILVRVSGDGWVSTAGRQSIPKGPPRGSICSRGVQIAPRDASALLQAELLVQTKPVASDYSFMGLYLKFVKNVRRSAVRVHLVETTLLPRSMAWYPTSRVQLSLFRHSARMYITMLVSLCHPSDETDATFITQIEVVHLGPGRPSHSTQSLPQNASPSRGSSAEMDIHSMHTTT